MKSYQGEREDWILTMVAAEMGICFLPEYTATFPGVVGCLGNITLGRAKCQPGQCRRPSLVTADCGMRASGSASSLAGFGLPKSARN